MEDKTIIINGTEKLISRNSQGSYMIYVSKQDIEWIAELCEKARLWEQAQKYINADYFNE